MAERDYLIEVKDLKKHFSIDTGFSLLRRRATVKAVDGVSFRLERGKTFGLVGESGCGKSTIGRLLLRLIEATSGSIQFEGTDILSLTSGELRELRRDMQMVFQDPYSSLNPRMTVAEIVGEPLLVHGIAKGAEKEKRVMGLLELVGLGRYHAKRYPHEFSGGQRQRIGIARALALNPKIIVCDEAVSALDVSIQSQVLNLLKDIQSEFNLTYLFISHNLNVIKHASDFVAVMYLGKIVEAARKDILFEKPNHPYTKALLSAIPSLDPFADKSRILLRGEIPSPINPPSGCRFHTRCNQAMPACSLDEPASQEIEKDHFSSCLLNDQ